MKFKELVKLLPRDEAVYITGHIHPDGDCFGAVLALSQLLKKTHNQVRVILEDKIKTYSYLPEFEQIMVYDGYELQKQTIIEDKYTLIVMDSGDLSRIEPLNDLFNNATRTVNIDHHDSNTGFADYNYVDTLASSTCELVGISLGLLEGESSMLTKDIATCLYTGIVYDTGVFKHSNTRKETHLVASWLLNEGIDFNFIINHLYFRRTRNSITAIKIATMNLEYVEENKIAVTRINQNELNADKIVKSDTEMIISMLNEIDGTVASVFFLEVNPGEFKASFRSSSALNVCEVAKKFNGGGHVKAAGCTLMGTYEHVKNAVLKELHIEFKRNY